MGHQHSVMEPVGTIAAASMGTVGLGQSIVPAQAVWTTGVGRPKLLSFLLGVFVRIVDVELSSHCQRADLLSVMVEVINLAVLSGATVVQGIPIVVALHA